MSPSVSKLLRLAIQMRDVQNLLNESISVSPHHYPGIITETLGGPAQKRRKHQVHQQEGPRGIAEVEDEDEEEKEL